MYELAVSGVINVFNAFRMSNVFVLTFLLCIKNRNRWYMYITLYKNTRFSHAKLVQNRFIISSWIIILKPGSRPAKCPDFPGTIRIFRPSPGCPGKR